MKKFSMKIIAIKKTCEQQLPHTAWGSGSVLKLIAEFCWKPLDIESTCKIVDNKINPDFSQMTLTLWPS